MAFFGVGYTFPGMKPITLAEPFECPVKHIPLKRVFDLCFSFLVFVMGFPVFFLIAIAIRLTSSGKIIYSHERIGRGGKSFRCFKFRTMYKDADLRLNRVLAKNPALRQEWEKQRKLKKDPRVTPIGHFLRRTSLDELPQFWNVLRGDLSVVGPRPVVRSELETYYGIKAKRILSIRPGLTGLWQVSGRNDTTYLTRILLDEMYIEKQTFLLDLRLVLKTIPTMLFSKGAY